MTDIEKLQELADKHAIDGSYELDEILLQGTTYGEDEKGAEAEFYREAIEQLNFNHVEQEGGGEGGTEYCFSIIELNGTFYKCEYSYASYDGYQVDDIWDWTPVKPVNKEVIIYE